MHIAILMTERRAAEAEAIADGSDPAGGYAGAGAQRVRNAAHRVRTAISGQRANGTHQS